MIYKYRMNRFDLEDINKAVNAIIDQGYSKVRLNEFLNVYKIPSQNPSKYTIRIDIKVEEAE